MNTFENGQTYTFEDFKGERCVWVRTNGLWISDNYNDRDDSFIAAVLAEGFGVLS